MTHVLDSMLAKYNCKNVSDYRNALKEISQEVALCGLSRGGFFDKAAFYGGTALRIFYGLDRFSEDLDFSLIKPDEGFELSRYFGVLEEELYSVDGSNKPFVHAQMKVYSKDAFSVVDRALSDSSGRVSFNDSLGVCAGGDCFVEALAGEDSAFMSWSSVDFADSSVQEIALLPSASLIVRTGVSAQENSSLSEDVKLESTPYFAKRSGSEYVFAHVPAGLFTIVAGDSSIAEVSLKPELRGASSARSLFALPPSELSVKMMSRAFRPISGVHMPSSRPSTPIQPIPIFLRCGSQMLRSAVS